MCVLQTQWLVRLSRVLCANFVYEQVLWQHVFVDKSLDWRGAIFAESKGFLFCFARRSGKHWHIAQSYAVVCLHQHCDVGASSDYFSLSLNLPLHRHSVPVSLVNAAIRNLLCWCCCPGFETISERWSLAKLIEVPLSFPLYANKRDFWRLQTRSDNQGIIDELDKNNCGPMPKLGP